MVPFSVLFARLTFVLGFVLVRVHVTATFPKIFANAGVGKLLYVRTGSVEVYMTWRDRIFVCLAASMPVCVGDFRVDPFEFVSGCESLCSPTSELMCAFDGVFPRS